MLTMVDLNQDKELSRSEMAQIAGGTLVDHLAAGIKAAAENSLKEGGGVDNKTALGIVLGVAYGIGLGLIIAA